MCCKEIVFTNGIWVSFDASLWPWSRLYELYLPQYGYNVFNMLNMEYYVALHYYARNVTCDNLCISYRFRSLSKLTGQFITMYLNII